MPKQLLTITVTQVAGRQHRIDAAFADAPAITVESKNPRSTLMQVALQAAIYLVMKQAGQATVAHAPIPRELRNLLKTI